MGLTPPSLPPPCALPVYDNTNQIMGYIVATNVSNTILRAHFAFMAFRNGVSMQRLINATNGESLDDTLSAKEVRTCVCVCMYV